MRINQEQVRFVVDVLVDPDKPENGRAVAILLKRE